MDGAVVLGTIPVSIVLPEPIADALCEHARSGAPEEVVGVLAGTHGESRSMVTRAYRARNAANDPRTRYEIAPTEEFELLERIDDAGIECVGFYHSHPRGPLKPSRIDAQHAAWPGYSYLIVSLTQTASDASIGSWRWNGEGFERESVRIE